MRIFSCYLLSKQDQLIRHKCLSVTRTHLPACGSRCFAQTVISSSFRTLTRCNAIWPLPRRSFSYSEPFMIPSTVRKSCTTSSLPSACPEFHLRRFGLKGRNRLWVKCSNKLLKTYEHRSITDESGSFNTFRSYKMIAWANRDVYHTDFGGGNSLRCTHAECMGRLCISPFNIFGSNLVTAKYSDVSAFSLWEGPSYIPPCVEILDAANSGWSKRNMSCVEWETPFSAVKWVVRLNGKKLWRNRWASCSSN